MLAWDKPQPRGKLPAVLKVRRIGDRGHQGGRGEGANARNREETLADRMRLTNGVQRLVVISQPLLQGRISLMRAVRAFTNRSRTRRHEAHRVAG